MPVGNGSDAVFLEEALLVVGRQKGRPETDGGHDGTRGAYLSQPGITEVVSWAV